MLSEVLRAGHEPTAGFSPLSTPDSILMSYQKLSWGQREGGTALGARAANGYLCIRMARLCYDTPPVEVMPFPIDMPEKTPWALSEDFYHSMIKFFVLDDLPR